MSYIGNTPISIAFLTDTFSGNGSTTAFTMTVAPANTSSIIVAITGVLQDPSTYSVSGTTLTFSAAPPTGTSNISVRYLGIPASGVTTTAYRTVTNFTATAGQTSFSTPSYTVGYIDVYRNGVRLVSTDYTATTGTTVVLNNACTVGDAVVTESFYVSSVLNALPTTGGTLTGQLVVNGATGQNPLITQVNSTEVMRIDSSGNMGIGGTPSGSYKLQLIGTAATTFGAWGVTGTTTAGAYAQFVNTGNTTIIGVESSAGASLCAGTSAYASIFGTSSAASVQFVTNNSTRATIDSSGVITSPLGGMQVISGTAQATTSGTFKDFTGIPSWVKRITVMFSGVSTNSTSNLLLQIGDSGGIENAGYTSTAQTDGGGSGVLTTGFAVVYATAAVTLNSGIIQISLITGTTWVASGVVGNAGGNVSAMYGTKALSDVLDRVRITTVNGTDTFDAGTVNILYE